MKPIKWAEGGPKEYPVMYDLIAQAKKNQVENTFPINIKGDQGNPGIAPCIIKELYFPPEAPCEVATLIESALVYQNSANYELAIECFSKARTEWQKICKADNKPLRKE